MEWTIVRPTFFAQNFSEGAWLDDVIFGTVAFPIGDVREPFVDADDIADAAVAALTEDRHIGQTYELTGPRLLSFGDAVAEIAAASGRDLTFGVGADGRLRCDQGAVGPAELRTPRAFAGEQAVEQARREAVAAADAVDDVELAGRADVALAVEPEHRAPSRGGWSSGPRAGSSRPA